MWTNYFQAALPHASCIFAPVLHYSELLWTSFITTSQYTGMLPSWFFFMPQGPFLMFIMFKRKREGKPCNMVTWKPFHSTKSREREGRKRKTQHYNTNRQDKTKIQEYMLCTVSWVLNNELGFLVHLELCLYQGS